MHDKYMTNQFSEHQENPKNRRILCNQGKIYLSFSSQESSAIFSSLYLNTRIKVVNVKLNHLAKLVINTKLMMASRNGILSGNHVALAQTWGAELKTFFESREKRNTVLDSNHDNAILKQ